MSRNHYVVCRCGKVSLNDEVTGLSKRNIPAGASTGTCVTCSICEDNLWHIVTEPVGTWAERVSESGEYEMIGPDEIESLINIAYIQARPKVRSLSMEENMVNVIKPDKVWRVVIKTNNLHCPFLCFPANYHGCNYRQAGGNIPACEFEYCPIKPGSPRSAVLPLPNGIDPDCPNCEGTGGALSDGSCGICWNWPGNEHWEYLVAQNKSETTEQD